MNQMRHDDLKAYRTQQEIDELNRLLEDDATTKEIAKRINVLLHMNIRNNPDGTPVSYKKRLEETTASLDVRDSYVKETLMVYNRAGITGIMRSDCKVKPDIADRNEDRLPADVLKTGDVSGTDNMMDELIAKMSERTGIADEKLREIMSVAKEYGMTAVVDNPAKVQRLWTDGQKHVEVAGFWLGKGTGIFSVATQNTDIVNGEFTIRKVFKDAVACAESRDAVDKVFNGDATMVDSSVCFSQEMTKYFSELRNAYPPEGGWHVHSFILDERAATDPDTGEPLIDGLPSIDGYTFEKTVYLCDFTSPIKAVFEMVYRRDDTNVQGWKVRDKVTSLILGASETSKPTVYIGAKTEISDPSVPTIKMYACVTIPGKGTMYIQTPSRELPGYDKMGSDLAEEFQDGISQADYSVKDMATELAGTVFQSTANAAQAGAAETGNGILKPIMVEAESGRKRIMAIPSISESLGAKKMLYTNGFMDLVGMEVTDDSFRISADKLNRTLHRKGYEEIHYTTIQDLVTKEGCQILECLKKECEEGLEIYQVEFRDGEMDFSHIPESAINPEIVADSASAYDWKEIERNLKRRNKGRDENDQLTLEQIREALSHMEKDPRKTVYVIFDGVVFKMQKEHRAKPHFHGFKKTKKGGNKKGQNQNAGATGQDSAAQEDGKATFQTHNAYILFQNKAYVIAAASMDEACRLTLGFLLKEKLLEDHELVFFSDGAREIKSTISSYFSFRSYSLYLDWHHVEQCLYQYFTMFLKGGKDRLKENEEIRQGFFNLLWEGRFEEAKEYIQKIDKAIVKNSKAGESILNYLKKKADHLYVFEIRKLAGLINSSNRVEQINDKLVSKRQKKNGMAWCPTGSRALTAWSMMDVNNGWETWRKTHEVSFEMHVTTVPKIYLPGDSEAA